MGHAERARRAAAGGGGAAIVSGKVNVMELPEGAGGFGEFTAELADGGPTTRLVTFLHVAKAGDGGAPVSGAPFSTAPLAGLPVKIVRVAAGWDTGTPMSVISSEVARDLGLVAAGRRMIHPVGADRGAEMPTHGVTFALPCGVGVPLEVVETPSLGPLGAMIGTDVISLGEHFTLGREAGRMVFGFRIAVGAN